MAQRRYNFNPGPAALPLQVLEQAQEELVDYRGLGLSLMEMSHRSQLVEQLNEETQLLLLDVLGLQKGYNVMFMGGGASTQFALIPLNFLTPSLTANYVLSGSFAEKAYKEATFIGSAHVAASSKSNSWKHVPKTTELNLADNSAYLHITTNNTIEGSRCNELPDISDVPVVADMTSDILSRKLDLQKLDMIYAGAQKNLGPAGVTAVIISDNMLQNASKSIPLILRYETFVKEKSLYNTPPVHTLYVMNLVLKWVVEQGGVEELENNNRAKASLLYNVIDASGGFYEGFIDACDRSHMNITWRMADENLQQQFIKESEKHGFEGLAGHRSVGGFRASAYNAVTMETCKALADYMIEFQRIHG